ncbi:MAG: DUF2249 domain-containing protein [Rhizobiales bacterium]|nr:DUF2249 domain-containing protein [Hyphomicrobiales bacterium]
MTPSQGIRLHATFKPIPLFAVMAEKGFVHAETGLADGEWEVLFTPGGALASATNSGARPTDVWPAPVVRLDSRHFDPPEPMVRILSAAESLKPGEALSARLRGEPVFLSRISRSAVSAAREGFTAESSIYELTVRAPV